MKEVEKGMKISYKEIEENFLGMKKEPKYKCIVKNML